MSACCRHYPGRFERRNRSVLIPRRRPSPNFEWVGSCIIVFEACSAFTRVTACRLAKSPMRPSTPEASAALSPPPPLRLLPGGAIQFPGGSFSPAVDQHLFTAHRNISINYAHRPRKEVQAPHALSYFLGPRTALCFDSDSKLMNRRWGDLVTHWRGNAAILNRATIAALALRYPNQNSPRCISFALGDCLR